MGKSKEMFGEIRQQEQQAQYEQLPVKKTIYNIHEDYMRLMSEIEYNEGEITPEINDKLAISKAELSEKAVSYGYVIRQYDFEIDQIKAEIERLSKIASRKDKIKADLKKRISDAMLSFNVLKIDQNNLSLSFSKSEVLIINAGAHIPVEYITTKNVETIDKKALKEAIKGGKEYLGIFIQENQNLQIK
jgi:hypothetical protein